MAVDESGDDTDTAAVDALRRRGGIAPAADPGDDLTLDEDGAVADDTQRRSVALRGVVGDQFGDPVIQGAQRPTRRSWIAEPSSAAASIR